MPSCCCNEGVLKARLSLGDWNRSGVVSFVPSRYMASACCRPGLINGEVACVSLQQAHCLSGSKAVTQCTEPFSFIGACSLALITAVVYLNISPCTCSCMVRTPDLSSVLVHTGLPLLGMLQ